MTNKDRCTLPSGYRLIELPLPLIIAGEIQHENMIKVGQNRFWLQKMLRKKGIRRLKDTHLCTIDHNGQVFALNRLS